MYSLWRIWRTSPRTMRARANQPVTPMSRAMLRAQKGDGQQQHQQHGDALDELHKAHEQGVGTGRGDAGQAAVGHAQHGDDRGAQQADEQGGPAAEPDDGIDVPAQGVCTEKEPAAGRGVAVGKVELGGVVVGQPGRAQAAQHQQEQQAQGQQGQTGQALPPAGTAQGRAVFPPARAHQLEGIVGEGLLRPGRGPVGGRTGLVHQQTTSPLLMRGSMASLMLWASRLLMMTMAPVNRTMSMSRL